MMYNFAEQKIRTIKSLYASQKGPRQGCWPIILPRKRGSMFLPALVCVSVTTITKKIVDGFLPNFMGRL